MNSSAAFGLLLDVDGPLASTVTRSMRVPSIAHDLVAIANAGCPLVFNTGRSDGFLTAQVIPPLVAAGLAPDAPVWGIGEKGATWFTVADGRIGEIHTDARLTASRELTEACRAIAERHVDLMFWDDTKRTMISIEQNLDIDRATYLSHQPELIAELDRAIADTGSADAFHTAPTIISVDVEHRDAGKAIGAERALALVRQRMAPPRRWFTAGDSDGDYDMAAWLHDQGFEATHLDVRPSGAQVDAAYPVLREIPSFGEGHAEDDITAAYLTTWRAQLAV